jgi:hypothetical protein
MFAHNLGHLKGLTSLSQSINPFEDLYRSNRFISINILKQLGSVRSFKLPSLKQPWYLLNIQLHQRKTDLEHVAAMDEVIGLEYFSLIPGRHNMN